MIEATYYTAKQVCARAGISRTALHDFVKRGIFPRPYHFGRRVRWKLAELESFEQRLSHA